jgi:acetoin utilization deacetylase AcuC-like enzyme
MTTAYITSERYLEHNREDHPENARRLEVTWELLAQEGLIARMMPFAPVEASREQIARAHSDDLLDVLDQIAAQEQLVMIGMDTYALPVSPEIARLAAGGAVRAVEAVLEGEADNALALVRPPGHHATRDEIMGFCLINNVAVAARHAVIAHGLRRVMIVDYDVHHGNGTQDIFYDDPTVFYFSAHQYGGMFYPGTGSGSETGVGEGKGTNCNVPLPKGTGDSGYARVFDEVLWPLARRYGPELILISVGFDAHWADPLAGMALSLTGYDALCREVIAMADALCDGRIAFVLEGGYTLDTVSQGATNIAYALLNDGEVLDSFGPSPRDEPDITGKIEALRRIHDI